MRVLVTGGAGFIGSHIADALLAEGHEVAALDDLSSGSAANLDSRVRLFEVDVRQRDRVRQVFDEFRPDWISHQAAQMSVSRSVREPLLDAEINLIGLINVLDGAVATGARRIAFASSGGVLYGETTVPAPEQTPANPISPYGITKWCGERYLRFYAAEHKLQCVALRYANVYGERQNPHGEAGVVAIFCQKMLRGEVCQVNGDGKYVRDYVHVSDVVQANLNALRSATDGFNAVNVGTGIPTDVNQLEQQVRQACLNQLQRVGRSAAIPSTIYGPARAGDLRSNLVSSEKARALWNWQPSVTLAAGLERTARWFAEREFGQSH